MEKKYILPIGSVVKLVGSDQKISIVGRGQLYNHEGIIGYFDYSAILYPQGIISEKEFHFFNHEDIEEIIFEGYRDELEKAFAAKYDEEIAKVEYPKLSIK